MKKILLSVLGVMLLAGCGDTLTKQEQNEIQQIDGMIYTYIVGKVEGNDDLLAEVLTPDAQGILVEGRHPYPGNAKEMGERYSITRYEHQFHEGVMTYEVKFYRPNTGKTSYYILPVINTENGWLIASNTSYPVEYLDTVKFAGEADGAEGIEVHAYKE